MNTYGYGITVEVAKGGFILTYPAIDKVTEVESTAREVFATSRKLLQKMKDVIETLSTTPEPAEK